MVFADKDMLHLHSKVFNQRRNQFLRLVSYAQQVLHGLEGSLEGGTIISTVKKQTESLTTGENSGTI